MNVYRQGVHRGEEPGVVGNDRAGMVLFSGCHLRCSFCYTPEVVEAGSRKNQTSALELEKIFHSLVEKGAENLNLISPSHVWKEISPSLIEFKKAYPKIPIVLKVSGYEGERLSKEFGEIADVVVMDFKVHSAEAARAVNLPEKYAAVATQLAQNLSQSLPTKTAAVTITDASQEKTVQSKQLLQGTVVRTLWLPMAPTEVQAIGNALRDLSCSVWNLMGWFIDPLKHTCVHAPDSWFEGALASQRLHSEMEIWKDGRRWMYGH